MARIASSGRIALSALGALGLLYAGLVGMRAVWPIDFQSAVRTAAAAQSLEPDLVYAVIYAESRFDPEAVSPRGAIGLMQIMPATSRWIAQQLNLNAPSDEELLDVEQNLRYGTWYLRHLLDRYDDVETALLAYNAGPTTVDRWLVESESPYSETVTYVRRVRAAQPVYRVYMRISGLLDVVPAISL